MHRSAAHVNSAEDVTTGPNGNEPTEAQSKDGSENEDIQDGRLHSLQNGSNATQRNASSAMPSAENVTSLQEEYLGPGYPAAIPVSLFVPHYPGSLAPVAYIPTYVPYSINSLHCHSPVIDYNYFGPGTYGSLQYPVHGNYIYGTHVYQYPASGGQYISSPHSLSMGGPLAVDPQDVGLTGLVMPNGFQNGYATGLPDFQVGMIPSVIVPEAGVISTTDSHSSSPLKHKEHDRLVTKQSRGNQSGEDSISQQLNHLTSSAGAPMTNVSSIDVLDNPTRNGSNANECVGESQQSQDCIPVNKTRVSKVKIHPLPKDARACEIYNKLSELSLRDEEQLSRSKIATKYDGSQKFNQSNFPIQYADAKHFIIKSYSEENILKSIQYGVWASTPNGNKKLDEAYLDAQQRASGMGSQCPVFLFFSVNGSRQFCGVAEMVGPVNHSRTMDFWEQHKWSGSFPVKWHIVKDLPNSHLRRIILENNENKPVTNSRDTQEVPFPQGLEMLSIFKSYPVGTSVLDNLHWQSNQKHTEDATLYQFSPKSFPRIGKNLVNERDYMAAKLGPHTDISRQPKLSLEALKALDNNRKEQNSLDMKDAAFEAELIEISDGDSREASNMPNNNQLAY